MQTTSHQAREFALLCLFLLFPLHVAGDRELNVNVSLPIKEFAVKTKTNISQSELFCSSLSLTDYKQDPAPDRRSARQGLYKCSSCAGWWLILCRTCQFCPLKRQRLPVSKQCAMDVFQSTAAPRGHWRALSAVSEWVKQTRETFCLFEQCVFFSLTSAPL